MHGNDWLPELFNDLMNAGMQAARPCTTAPATNVMENDEMYVVQLAAPGMKKEDFFVNINDEGNLVVKMEQKADEKKADEKMHYLRREFSYTKYEQTLILPDDVDKNKIEAKVEDGILTVNLPKVEEAKVKVARSIEIQ
ncbi:MAG: Hsp20/alpha crystallin family protein [Prevotella sp.]|nr:Hsp20/alpha crystallin family protein [Prevotella sp.]